MKKIYLTIILILSVMLLFVGSVYAATGTVFLNVSESETKAGQTFTTTVSASTGSSASINGISAYVEYDKNVLEMVSSDLVDNQKWSNLDTFPSLVALWLPSTSETTSADIYKITFRVKDGVTSENTTVKLTNIVLSTSNAEESIGNIEKTIKISKEEKNNTNTVNGTNTTGVTNSTNSTNTSNTNVSNTNDSAKTNSTNNSESTSKSNSTNTTTENTSKNSSSTNNSSINTNKSSSNTATQTSNTTTNNGNLPYTGSVLNKVILVSIVVFSIFGIRGYILYKKYRNI